MPACLVGYGGALVDAVVEVSDAEFAALGLKVPRGGVQRLDADEQRALLARFAPSRVRRFPGGSAANTLRAAAACGAQTRLLAVTGDDEDGDFFRQAMAAAGVDTGHVRGLPAFATDCCVALVTPDGERTMLPMLGAGAHVDAVPFGAEDLSGGDWLHFEGYATRYPQTLERLQALADARDLAMSLDLGAATLVRECRPAFEDAIFSHPLEVLCGNLDEVRAYTDEQDEEGAIAHFGGLAQCCVVLKGAKGASLLTAENDLRKLPIGVSEIRADRDDVPAAPLPGRLVDTVGAGDSWLGAFLAAVLGSADVVEAAERACAFAAGVVCRKGAQMQD